MLRARYWLLSKIAEMPKVFTYGIGVLTAALVVMVSIVATLWLDKASVSRQHVQALRIYQAAIAESRELLAHLATHREGPSGPRDTDRCEHADQRAAGHLRQDPVGGHRSSAPVQHGAQPVRHQ